MVDSFVLPKRINDCETHFVIGVFFIFNLYLKRFQQVFANSVIIWWFFGFQSFDIKKYFLIKRYKHCFKVKF